MLVDQTIECDLLLHQYRQRDTCGSKTSQVSLDIKKKSFKNLLIPFGKHGGKSLNFVGGAAEQSLVLNESLYSVQERDLICIWYQPERHPIGIDLDHLPRFPCVALPDRVIQVAVLVGSQVLSYLKIL